jgi:hypothetical protein
MDQQSALSVVFSTLSQCTKKDAADGFEIFRSARKKRLRSE